MSLHKHECVSAVSDLILKCSALLFDSCLLASGRHMLPSLPVHVKALQSLKNQSLETEMGVGVCVIPCDAQYKFKQPVAVGSFGVV